MTYALLVSDLHSTYHTQDELRAHIAQAKPTSPAFAFNRMLASLLGLVQRH